MSIEKVVGSRATRQEYLQVMVHDENIDILVAASTRTNWEAYVLLRLFCELLACTSYDIITI
jgi:hypothetical protein